MAQEQENLMFPQPEVVSSYHVLSSNMSSPQKCNLMTTVDKMFQAVGGEQGVRWVTAWGEWK